MPTSFKVNFQIIGAQKCGTTALAKFLSVHPEICMASPKEAHFFDRANYAAKDNHQYQQAFPDYQGELLVGESTPIYFHWPFIAPRLQEYNPDMKLIVLLRNPVERAISHYMMESARGTETRTPLLAMLLEPFRLWRHRGCYNMHRTSLRLHSYVERGLYSRCLNNLLAYFPRDQILILRSDDLIKNHDHVLHQVYAFLGVKDRTTLAEPEHVFSAEPAAPKPGWLTRWLLKQRFRNELNRLEKLLGWDLDGWR